MKKYVYVCENENLKENVKKLQDLGYTYIIKGQDKFLSGWGYAKEKHLQLIVCRTWEELQAIRYDLEKDNTIGYVNWCYLSNYTSIYNWTRNKSFTIRNDWTRAFYDESKKELYKVGV